MSPGRQPGRPPRRTGGRPGRTDGGGRPGRTDGGGRPGRTDGGGRPGGGARRREEAGAGELGGQRVEGRQAVRELLRAGRRRVRQVLVADTATGVDDLLAAAHDAGVPVHRVGRAQLDAAAATDAPQGVLADADPMPVADLGDLVDPATGGPPLLVVFDGLTDPHNLGAVLRSALCAGATGAVVGRHRAAHLTPAALKAAAGAAEHLPIAVVAGIPSALAEVRRAGVWTVGLAADGPISLWDLPVATEAVAIVLGAEGAGLSRLARDRCEVVARVPMRGPLDSLNVSATAALACFEVARRRAAG